jgi:hypothetical protein
MRNGGTVTLGSVKLADGGLVLTIGGSELRGQIAPEAPSQPVAKSVAPSHPVETF